MIKKIISILVIDNINDMNLQQFEYIVALDAHKSFSKAAESCFITQATLSTMVKKLEQELNLVIFDRKTTPIITTDSGQKIVDEAKRILLHTQQLKTIASEVKGTIEGELKIGIIPTVASSLLHRILPTLIYKYPTLKLNIQEITTNNILKQLKTGELDVGILATPVKGNDFEKIELYYEKLMVYGNSVSNQTKYQHPKDLERDKIWLLEEGNCLADQVMNLCALNKKVMSSNLSFKPNSLETLINMVEHMDGLTLIPELFCTDLSESQQMKVQDFTSPFPVREISLLYNRPYAKSRLVETLSNEIKQLIRPILSTNEINTNEMNVLSI